MEIAVVVYQQHVVHALGALAELLVLADDVAVLGVGKEVAADGHNRVVLLGHGGNLVIAGGLLVLQAGTQLGGMGDLDAGHVEGGIADLHPLHGDGQGVILIALEHTVFLIGRDIAVGIGDITGAQVHGQGNDIGRKGFCLRDFDDILGNRAGDEHRQQQEQGNKLAHDNSSDI